jgi:voltage-gated potassium channel Kch
MNSTHAPAWPTYAAPQVVYANTPSTGKGFAVTALVLGIIGALFGLIPLTFFLAIPLGVLAFIFGAIAWRRAAVLRRRGWQIPRGMARTGFVLGVAALALGIIGYNITTNAFNELDECLTELTQEACE